MPTKITPEQYPEIFWSKVQKTTDCWLWLGSKHSGKWPYGMVKYQGKTILAHRVAWILSYGDIPFTLCVLHRCDVPACVRPDHLFLGTLKDNTQDAIRKGKYAHVWASTPKGEGCTNAKLTLNDVEAIRQAYNEGASQRTLAKRFNVVHGNIYLIVNNKRWRRSQ